MSRDVNQGKAQYRLLKNKVWELFCGKIALPICLLVVVVGLGFFVFLHTTATALAVGNGADTPEGAVLQQSPGLRGAQGILGIAGPAAGFPAAEQQPEVVIGRIIQGMILVIGVIFGLLVIYGGYLWMIARGNEELVKKAKGILEAAVIGIILVVGAYAITSYVVERVIGAAYEAPTAGTP